VIPKLSKARLLVRLGFLAFAVSAFVRGAHEAALDEDLRTFAKLGNSPGRRDNVRDYAGANMILTSGS
jgi:hypothetical protein